MTRWRTILYAIGLGAAPILLVFLQPDLGTALVYARRFFALLFFVGVRWRQLLALLVVAALAILSVLWFLPAGGGRGAEALSGRPTHGLVDRRAIRAGSTGTSTSRSPPSAQEA